MKINMLVKVELSNDRDYYFNDDRVKQIVSLLISESNSALFTEIINVINNVFDLASLDDKMPSLYGAYWEYENLDEYGRILYAIYRDHCHSNLRGAVLEKLIYELVNTKYRDENNLSISCNVLIDNWKSEKTVDVFYYSNIVCSGETYECKVNPLNLECNHIQNLKDIYIISNKKIDAYFASFASTKAIDLKIRDLGIQLGGVGIIGRENLLNIAKIE